MTEYAEKLPYWKTSKSSPDTWMERSKREIEKHGGTVLAEGFGMEAGRAAFMLGFEIQGYKFKAVWPVIDSEYTGQEYSGRRQAATMLYHDIKAKCISMAVKGPRAAFFEYLMLPDGRTAAHATDNELIEGIPQMLLLEN